MQAALLTDERYSITVIDPSDGQIAIDDAARYGLTVTEEVMLVVQLSGAINQYFTTGGGGAGNIINITAAADIGGHRVITMQGQYADCGNPADAFAVAGITLQAVASGTTVQVQTYGELTETSWNWLVGQPVYLGTAGQLTQTPPSAAFILVVGIPVTATTLLLDIQQPIILS